jgi:enoyl-[acyl-carrier protein] reductase I
MNTSINQKLMHGKRGLVMGVANNRSIAWGIAKALHNAGAELAFSYQGEAIEKRIIPLAKELGSDITIECDVSDEKSIINLIKELESEWGKIDFLVHAIAYSDKNELTGRYIDTSKENFMQTMHISCYSFTSILKHAERILNPNASVVTLTYSGAERVMPHYNVMGVAKAGLEASVKYLSVDMGKNGTRVNAISAGPIKTLAASGIGDFRYILKWNEYNSPLRRTVDIEDVGNAAIYLLSDLSKSVTGEILHVDAGYNIVGMKNEEAPDITVT